MNKLKAKRHDNKEPLSGIVGGAFSLTLSTIILKVLGLVYKIPLANILGDEGMGYFNSAYTVYSFFYLLCTAGVPKAVMILISEAKAKGKRIEEYAIIKTALMLFVAIGFVVFSLFVILSAPLARIIGNSRSALTMLSIAPSIIFISVSGVVRGYLSANMKLLDIAVSQIIEGVGKLVLGLLLASYARSINLPTQIVSALTILGVTFGSFVGLVYLLVVSKIKKQSEIIGQNCEKAKIIKNIFRISIPITLSAAVMSITNIIDLGLIMRRLIKIGYTELESNTLYGNYTTLAVPMFNLAIAIITPISIAHLPVITNAFAKNDKLALKEAKKSAFELTAFLTAPVMLGLFAFAKEILSLLFGNSGIETGAILLRLLCPSIFFSAYLIIVNTILEASGAVRAPIISMSFGAAAKILVSYLLISNPNFGIAGAPIGTVVSYAVGLMVSLVIYTKKYDENLPVLRYGISMYINAFASVAVARAVFDNINKEFSEFLRLFISISVCGIIYLFLCVLVGLISKGKYSKLANYTKQSHKNYKIRRKAGEKI